MNIDFSHFIDVNFACSYQENNSDKFNIIKHEDSLIISNANTICLADEIKQKLHLNNESDQYLINKF